MALAPGVSLFYSTVCMAIISYGDLSSLKTKHPGKKVVFCSGTFDLLHAGHLAFFEDCRKLGDILVVAVGRDEEIRKNKGPNRPIVSEMARLKLVDALKHVDYSFLTRPTAENAGRLSFLEEIFASLKPDIWVANSDENEKQIAERKIFSQSSGIPLVILERIPPPEQDSPSTSSIIKKIRDLS